MSFIDSAPCQFVAVAGGTADFVVNTIPTGAGSPAQLGAINGKQYPYVAMSSDNTQFESGLGTWVSATNTLQRTTLRSSSTPLDTNGNAVKQNFTAPPTVVVVYEWTQALTQEQGNIPSSTAVAEGQFPSGTSMLFVQTAAPTGWTKSTVHNDKALRIVNGTAGFGGSNSFLSTFTSRTSDATTLSISQIPAHTHPQNVGGNATEAATETSTGIFFPDLYTPTNTGSQGGSGSHAHTYDMRVQYVDAIIATKN